MNFPDFQRRMQRLQYRSEYLRISLKNVSFSFDTMLPMRKKAWVRKAIVCNIKNALWVCYLYYVPDILGHCFQTGCLCLSQMSQHKKFFGTVLSTELRLVANVFCYQICFKYTYLISQQILDINFKWDTIRAKFE